METGRLLKKHVLPGALIANGALIAEGALIGDKALIADGALIGESTCYSGRFLQTWYEEKPRSSEALIRIFTVMPIMVRVEKFKNRWFAINP